jgi:amidohydrolase
VLTVGKINGGTRSNIIAEKVILEGTVRTLSERNREKIPRLMENIVKGATHSFGADYTFSYRKGAPSLYNHPELAKIMLPTLLEVLGEEQVKKISPQMVAEDFSYYCFLLLLPGNPGILFLPGC